MMPILVKSDDVRSRSENRNLIWQRKGKIKHAPNYPDAYITEGERKVSIKGKTRDFRTQKFLDAISSSIMKNMFVEIFQST